MPGNITRYIGLMIVISLNYISCAPTPVIVHHYQTKFYTNIDIPTYNLVGETDISHKASNYITAISDNNNLVKLLIKYNELKLIDTVVVSPKSLPAFSAGDSSVPAEQNSKRNHSFHPNQF